AAGTLRPAAAEGAERVAPAAQHVRAAVAGVGGGVGDAAGGARAEAAGGGAEAAGAVGGGGAERRRGFAQPAAQVGGALAQGVPRRADCLARAAQGVAGGFRQLLAAAAAGLGVEQVHRRGAQQGAAEQGHRVFSLAVSHTLLL